MDIYERCHEQVDNDDALSAGEKLEQHKLIEAERNEYLREIYDDL